MRENEDEEQKNTGKNIPTYKLSCFQASCDLANYLLKHGRDYISGSNILELGAGCGLLGIALGASSFVKSITLSDGCVDVLNVIRNNIRSNFSEVIYYKVEMRSNNNGSVLRC